MPESTVSLSNPFAIPEPHYLPGYTGHCPQYKDIVGQTYGKATHEALESNDILPSRKHKTWSYDDQPKEEDLDAIECRHVKGKIILSRNIPAGYTGHIPKSVYQVGKNFTDICIEGIIELENRKKRYEDYFKNEE